MVVSPHKRMANYRFLRYTYQNNLFYPLNQMVASKDTNAKP